MHSFPFMWNKQGVPPVSGPLPKIKAFPPPPSVFGFLDTQDTRREGTWYGEYCVEKLIGEGNGTSIYKAVRESDGVAYALKVMRNTEKYQRECEVHACMPRDSDHLVTYIEHFVEAPFLVLVMELFSRNLLDIEISPCRLLNIMLNTAKGVAAIDNQGFVADDLKPENYFMRGYGSRRVAIGDFGGVRCGIELSTEHTAPYCAPEQMNGPTRSDATMVYGWATSMEKIITGKVGLCRAGISLSRYTPWVGTFFDPLIYHCTRREPHLRPTPAQLLAEVQHLARVAQHDVCPVHGLPRFGCGSCMSCRSS